FNCGIGPLIFADQFIQLPSSLASEYIYGLGEHRGSFLHDVNWSRYAFWSRDVFPAVSAMFNCGIGPLIFADQFIQLSSSLASKYIYGLGEHCGSFLHDVNWSRYAFWSRDVFHAENLNLYSVHPFYLSIEDDGNAHGVFLLNSNAMESIFQMSPSITWRTVGGVLDCYVFFGPSLDQVIQQYTEVIGRTFMPPYWGLGFHLCRWGYETVDGTRKVTDRMRNAKIPQDVQWNDIDYAVAYKDCTLNKKVFGDLPKFIDELHNNGQHYIHIM
ncbi:lysosomal alpha-glucosidase-like, partial [Saccoglossus kowalevskii]|uniref:Lysosomal alpha-glucosidase-like n=1 Tax=Saccoglossus kowalevskii TaxID=10224 RepID=A0ABM0MJ35_SACKO